MVWHLKKVFAGEYDIPCNGTKLKILDLGANCGAFSVWASHRWPGCIVECYEPHPETYKDLIDNVAFYPNITAHRWAIGKPGMRPLFDGPNNCGEASLQSMDNNPLPQLGRHVEVRDPLSLPEADIIKLDIEGSEWEVLEPLIKGGRTFKAVLLEFHNEDLRVKIDRLLETDYRLVSINLVNYKIGTVCYVHKDYFE